jgi:hypothetical protein
VADIPKPKPKNYSKILDMLNTPAAAKTFSPKTYVNLIGKYSRKAYDNGELSKKEYMEIVQPLFSDAGIMATEKIKQYDQELNKYAIGGRVNFLKGGDTKYNAMVFKMYAEAGGKEGTGMDIDSFAEKYFPKMAQGGRIGYSEGSDYFDEQKTNVRGKKTTGPMPGGKTPQIPEEEFLKYQQFKKNKVVPISSDSKPEYGTKEYFKQNLDNLDLEQFIEKPFLLNPFSIGLIEDRLNSFEKAGGDSSRYRNLYEKIKQENTKYFQSLSEAEQKAYIDRHKKSLEKDIGLGILPGQEELGILDIQKEEGIPQPKKDLFDIEGFKKYRMDVANGGRIGFELGSMDPDTLALKEKIEEIMDIEGVGFGEAFKQAMRELASQSKE